MSVSLKVAFFELLSWLEVSMLIGRGDSVDTVFLIRM